MDEVMILEGVHPEEYEEEDCPLCDEIEYWDEGPGGRHCVAVKRGSDGTCRCAEYEGGTRPPHTRSFKDMCSAKNLDIIIGGRKIEGGNKMAGRKKGWFGAGIIEAVGIRPDLLKQIIIAGVVMAGGAYIVPVVSNSISNALKLKGQLRNVALVALAAISAGLVYKFTKKKDIAMAWGAGPIAIVVLALTGKLAEVATGQAAITPVSGMGLVTGQRSAIPFEPLAQPPTGVFPTVSNLFAESTVL